MKRAQRLIALLLCVALVFIVQAPQVGAEPSDALDSLMQGVDVPDTYTLEVSPPAAEGSEAIQKNMTINCSSGDGQPAQAVLQLSFLNMPDLEASWAERSEGYAEAVIDLASGQSQINPRLLAEAIKDRIELLHNASSAGSANSVIQVNSVQVTYPYYEELKNGSKGPVVARFQQKLIELGFLDGQADGQFGPMTKKGVEALQAHIRSLEQEIIDAMPTPEPTPEPTPSPTPDPSASDMDQPEASVEPMPTPTPKPEPKTQLTGVADAELQAYLYSSSFSIAGPTLRLDDKNDAVLRLQKRLVRLGCLTGTPDGYYGGDTQRGVRIFQHYNGLKETGVADHDLQLLLYSGDAKKPDYPLMTEGSKGDEVKYLQERMKQLGFMVGAVDGGYGAATVTGVKNLQTYMRKAEEKALSAQANQSPAITGSETAPKNTASPVDASLLTIEVNGVADPLLMDAFFADDFPAIPDPMQTGSSGAEVERLQRRLYDLEYLYSSPDGDYGGGTAKAVTEFQKRNKLTQSGAADAKTIAKLFSGEAKKALKPYVLKISIEKQRVYAYAPDANEEYTRLVRTMKCSTGLAATPTIKGTFQASTGPGARWHYFKKFKCWAQYAYSIQGDYLFHSVLYNTKGGPVTQSSVNNLGRRASHGCVRLTVEDAKWIWTNCPKRTKVIIY